MSENNGAVLLDVVTPANPTVPPVDPGPQRLSREELLQIENHFLKIQNLQLQQEHMKKDMVEGQRQIGLIQNEVRELKASLNRKYAIDLDKCHVGPDGVISRPQGN